MYTAKSEHYMRIGNLIYRISDTPIKIGDMLLDRKDFSYGVCEYIDNEYLNMRDGWVVELHIPISRVYKLEIVPSPNQIN